jgi:hypothetical protein
VTILLYLHVFHSTWVGHPNLHGLPIPMPLPRHIISDHLRPGLPMETSERKVSGCHLDFQSFILFSFYMIY